MKPRLKSKTYGLAGLLMALAIAILSMPELQALVGQLQPMHQAIALGVIAAAVAILREMTSTGVAGWRKAPDQDIHLTATAPIEPTTGMTSPEAADTQKLKNPRRKKKSGGDA